MSEQKGLVKLKGKMDGISFFQSEGKHLARMVNAPDKNRILTDAKFVRTRENNSEFGGCALASKTFRLTFAPIMSTADSRISARLTGLFKEINLNGDGTRGKRKISLSENRVLLKNLEFNVNRSVVSLFTGLFATANSADRTSGSIVFDKVLLKRVAKPPAGATHVVFTQALGVMSDIVYDEVLKRYTAADTSFDRLVSITNSEYIPLDTGQPVSLTITTALPANTVLNPNVSVIQCFGVSYYQAVKAEFYDLRESDAMTVVQVF